MNVDLTSLTNVRLFVIGAGFSAPLGAPVMSNFISEAKNLYNSNRDKFGRFNEIFKLQNSLGGIYRRFNTDIENIENLFNILEWQQYLESSDASTQFNNLKYLITETLKHKIDFSGRRFRRSYGEYSENKNYPKTWLKSLNKEGHSESYRFGEKSVYEQFMFSIYQDSLKRGLTNVFICLNYDNVLETNIKELVLQYKIVGVDNIISFSKDEFYIIKPHGSVDWELHDSAIKVSDVTANPFIIPPSWLKMSDRNGSSNKFIKELWSCSGIAIKEAVELNILGYSLPDTDQYFKSLLSYGFASNTSLNKICVIDSSEATIRKWGDVLKFEREIDFSNGRVLRDKHIALVNTDIVDALHEGSYLGIKHPSFSR